MELILGHYEALDSRYKAVIPLKRVYVPEPIEEAEGQAPGERWCELAQVPEPTLRVQIAAPGGVAL